MFRKTFPKSTSGGILLSSDWNKENIQTYATFFLTNSLRSNKHLLLSGHVTKNNEIENVLKVKNVTIECKDLALSIKETDSRITPHHT